MSCHLIWNMNKNCLKPLLQIILILSIPFQWVSWCPMLLLKISFGLILIGDLVIWQWKESILKGNHYCAGLKSYTDDTVKASFSSPCQAFCPALEIISLWCLIHQSVFSRLSCGEEHPGQKQSQTFRMGGSVLKHTVLFALIHAWLTGLLSCEGKLSHILS